MKNVKEGIKSNKLFGTFLVFISALSFGTISLFANLAYREGISIESLLFLRFFTGALILWSYLYLKKIDFKTSKKHLFHLFMISIIGYVGCTSTFFYALKYISSSLATILYFCYPVIIIIYELIFKRENVSNKKIVCLVLTMIGLIFIVNPSANNFNLLGVSLAFSSSICYAYYFIGSDETQTKNMDPILISTYVISFCALFYFVQCLLMQKPLVAPNFNSFIYAIILTFFCSLIPIYTLALGIKIVGVSNASLIGAFEPFFVAFLGIMFLGEKLTLNLVLGSVLIVFSMVILQLPSKAKDSTLKNKLSKAK
ncbi:MAG: DMT family transporter [Peptostreptococcaceae bacterium]|nr:DMT family transporter [Peptostreptococcaceae bacterium]